MSARKIPLEERFWAKVDKTATCWNWTANAWPSGYGVIRIDDKRTANAHRLSYEMAFGPIPGGLLVDHMCHNKSCVKPSHLRLVTNKENGENRKGAASNSKSGVRGVSWHKSTKTWRSSLRHNGQDFHVGHFATIEEAEAAVVAKRLELFTHNDVDRRAA